MTNLLLAAFGTALGGAALLTPVSMALARRWGVLDQPESRKVHATPIPRWGGMAIFGGVLAAAAFLALFSPAFDALLDYTRKTFEEGEVVEPHPLRLQMAGVLLASAGAWFLGAWDDRRPLPPAVKLMAQIIVAYVAMIYGVRMAGVSIPGHGFVVFPLWLSQVLTLSWLVGFMNVVNVSDGLDGLAAGVCALAAASFAAVCVIQSGAAASFTAVQLRLSAVLAAAVCGACVGFLPYNFSPAKVFMGDGGSLFLGFMLGAVSLTGTVKTGALMSLVIPLLAVALPVTDMAFALARRWKARRGLMQADRGHFHHILLDRGWTPREVTLLAYVVTLLFSMGTILLAFYRGRP